VIAGIDEKGRLEDRIGPSDRVLLFSSRVENSGLEVISGIEG
jgi:hypothetical protein